MHLDRLHVTHFVLVHRMQPHLQHFGVVHYPFSYVLFKFLASRQPHPYNTFLITITKIRPRHSTTMRQEYKISGFLPESVAKK
jgi:hypothetical protein